MDPRRRKLINTYMISAMIALFGALLIYYFLLWGGVLLVLIAIGMIIRAHFPQERNRARVRSFWVFDRAEKGDWEDVDRIIRR